ncbi:hypothetical protein M422DRAFT_276610 [Sphaerobolus stellatus SS14]|uniref:Uncharacterized protein n=1 Tax=Sphaerobolus stellatus (strain SS14) TaxID=990650 RepID=A0A0C9U1N7_SPHS4|nr:hypothetical protein M422DRAFT_276610 [Sphaerobolus stellatus SS14]
MTQDNKEEEYPVLLPLMAWATRKMCVHSVCEEVALWEEAARMKQLQSWAWHVDSTGLIGGVHHRNMAEEEGSPGLVWKRQGTFQAKPSFMYQV